MPELSLFERFQMTEAANCFVRLLVLDKFWTTSLDRTEPIPASEVAALRTLTGEMIELLDKAPGLATGMHSVIQQRPELLAEVHQKFMEADEPGMRKVRWKVLVESHGGVTALYIGA